MLVYLIFLFVSTGAGEEARTLDIFLGKEVLYQLSYARIKLTYLLVLMVRIELTTASLPWRCATYCATSALG